MRKTIFKRLPYFKALTIDDKRWVEGSIVRITKTYTGEKGAKNRDIWQIIDNKGISFNVDKDTICQYTGHRDANGNRVFENDILEWKPTIYGTDIQIYVKFIVIQELKGWKVKTLKSENSAHRFNLHNISISTNIGNAITDSELLEGKTLKNLLDRWYLENDDLID